MNNLYTIPADVPSRLVKQFVSYLDMITKSTGKLFLFTGDHKVEHMDADFAGPQIPPEVHDIEHLFRIANHGSIGAFAIHPGLIARHGLNYPDIPYIAKLNAKTNLIPATEHDPYSAPLATLEDILQLQRAGLLLCGVGYTIYLGSIYEETMMEEAGKLTFEAHQHGLISILWVYPRGHHVEELQDASTLAGAAGIGACLGADFVKLNTTSLKHPLSSSETASIIEAAGNTQVVLAGGPRIATEDFLAQVKFYMEHGAGGIAAGRNVYQYALEAACTITDTIASLVY
jgi:DhnA family fructose-bisphosphate aldolase class Ia